MKTHKDLRGNNIAANCKENIDKARELKNDIIKNYTKYDALKVLDKYNTILVHVDEVLSTAALLSQVHPDAKIRTDAEACEQHASSFVTDLSLDKDIYEAMLSQEKHTLDQEASRVLEHALRDFRRAGVNQDEKTRQKIKEIREELVKLGQEFGQNIRDERFVVSVKDSKELAGLPKDFIDNHKPNSEGLIEISTDAPDYLPVMHYAHSEKLKKDLRFKYLNRGQKNGPVLQKIIEKRSELAQLLKYKSYADYVAEDKMIKSAANIHDFINNISDIAKSSADKEYKELLKFKKKSDKNAVRIEGYESAYLEQAYKKEVFDFDAQEARHYFSYNNVRDGLLEITSKLFDIRYEPVKDALVWHDSVQSYDLFDQRGKLGRIYLDMHPREGKYKHAAQFTARSGLKDQQYPEGALVCNFPKDLMEHDQVVTIFHEFGHLLHHIFAGSQRWIPFSGVATEWDFVEAPSQFLEEWAWDAQVLALFAKHDQTKEPISEALVKKMRAAEEFGKGLLVRQQMFYAALSADYFDLDPKSFDMLEHLKKVQSHYSYFPYEEGTHFHYSFGHLDGYSAMYYTYMWSLSIAKDLLEPFKRDGLMNSKHATRFKDLVLKPGGSKDADELIKNFLGRPFSFDALKAWLKNDDQPISAEI